MAAMSQKFKEMGGQVYLDAEKGRRVIGCCEGTLSIVMPGLDPVIHRMQGAGLSPAPICLVRGKDGFEGRPLSLFFVILKDRSESPHLRKELNQRFRYVAGIFLEGSQTYSALQSTPIRFATRSAP